MSKFILMLALLLLTSCSLFKNTTKIADEQNLSSIHQSSLTIKEQKHWFKNSESILFYKDSVKRDYQVQIWPQGLFTYSSAKGFIGQADSIRIIGGSSAGTSSAKGEKIIEHDKGQLSVSATQKEKLVVDNGHQVTTETVSWKVIVASIAVTGLIAWVVFKNLKN